MDDIKTVVDCALELAAINKKYYNSKIDWTILECSDVEQFYNRKGYSGIRVKINGAAQNSFQLQQFVEDFVYSELKIEVEVLT
jgi:hypothetical protein